MPYADPEMRRKHAAEYRAKHRAELAAKQSARYYANPKPAHAYAIAYRKAHPAMDRALNFASRSASHARRWGVPGKVYARDLLKTHDLPCLYCGGPAKGWDHVVPMSKGGENTIANLVRCCYRCNRQKSAKMPSEWRPDWTESDWVNGTVEQVLRGDAVRRAA